MNEIVYAGKHSVTYTVSRHEHNSWELIYCTSGRGEFIINHERFPYEKGDVVVIPPKLPHTNYGEDGFTNIHLNMTDTTLPFKKPVVIKDDANEFIYHAFNAAFFHFYGDPSVKQILLSAYGDLIVSYLVAYRKGPTRSKVVEEIENNIIQNYPDGRYELDEYLRSFPFSYDYLRKLFKKELGVTPHQYLSDKRLQAAADRLSSPYSDGLNIAEIAHMCGFREPLYFSRMFKKKYGVSPSYYMEKKSQEVVVEDADSVKIMLSEEEPGEMENAEV
ncbi:MAG: AraC family transcriptional regulator [Firmicutes bacterium]|nr:AraC family transcriptional regulator [Bacillota bacterium]